jgi:hypothetical protein
MRRRNERDFAFSISGGSRNDSAPLCARASHQKDVIPALILLLFEFNGLKSVQIWTLFSTVRIPVSEAKKRGADRRIATPVSQPC